MTVGDSALNQVNHLPEEVTQVKKETIKAFPHTKRVGGYLLGQTLGVGSFAKVKEGLHLTTGEKVAVKIIDKKRAKTDNYVRKNLRREGKLLQLVRHPNVVSLLEVMETDNSYYLVTEICRGGDLMEYISARKRLSEVEVSKFVRQIVSAVDYLHRMGIIHRDLKIENLLLDENKNIKLIDFGLSNFIKVADSPEGTQAQEFCVTQCGSPAYAAPELLNHEKYGLQVDLWSIGVNMYAMLTGGLPFTVQPFNIKALYSKMRDRQINPLPDGLSRECRDLLCKFLTPDPARRVTVTEALSHPWLMQGNKPVTRSPCPNRMRASDLDADILSHMSDNLNFRMAEVIKFVTTNTPSPACATYHLYHEKLQHYNTDMRLRGHVSAATAVTSRSRSEDSRITLHLQKMSAEASNQKPALKSALTGGLSTPKRQAVMLETTVGSGTASTTNSIKKEINKGTEGHKNDSSKDKKDNKSVLTRYDLMKINSADVWDPAAPDVMVFSQGRPSPGVLRRSTQQEAKELLTKGKPVLEVPTPRGINHVDIGKNFIEKQIQKAKDHAAKNDTEHLKDKFNFAHVIRPAKNETEHLKDKFNFAYVQQNQSKNGVCSPKAQHLPIRNVKNEAISTVVSEQNWSKTSEEMVLDKCRFNTEYPEQQHQYIIMRDDNNNNHHDSMQPSQSRRYIQNNRLLSRRGAIKTIDMNASSIPDESNHLSSLNGGPQNIRTGSHPSPTFSKIIPKQFKPFRSAQDRPRLSENCPPHFLKQPQKAKTSESMILHGKNLLNTACSEDLNSSPKCAASSPPKPAIVRRKLAKRQRINEVSPSDGVDQVLTTDLLISDVLELKCGREDGLITSSLPSVSPALISR